MSDLEKLTDEEFSLECKKSSHMGEVFNRLDEAIRRLSERKCEHGEPVSGEWWQTTEHNVLATTGFNMSDRSQIAKLGFTKVVIYYATKAKE